MIAEHFEHPVAPDLDASIAKLIFEHLVEFSAAKTRLLTPLPPDKGNDELFVDLSPALPPSLLVVILARHRHLETQTLDAYPSSPSDFLPCPVDTRPACFFLKASASVSVRSHKISKKDSANA